MKHTLLAFFTALLFCCRAGAQEMSPAQVFAAPLTANPAATGLMAADSRLSANYETRNTYWNDHYHNLAVSYDMGLLRDKLPRGHAVGIGLSYFRNANESTYEQWHTSAAALSFAYHIGLGTERRHHISIGTQTAGGTFDVNTRVYARRPAYVHRSGLYLDYSAGIMYSGILSRTTSLYGGFAMYNISSNAGNNPVTGYRLVMHTGATFTLGHSTLLFAHATLSFDALNLTTYARIPLAAAGAKRAYPVNAYAGVVMLAGQAFMPYLGFEAYGTRLGLSMDTKSLTSEHYTDHSYQLSLIYTGGFGRHKSSPDWKCATMY